MTHMTAAARSIVPATLALGITLASAIPVSAQVSVEVSPLRVELQAGPGSTTTQPVTLTNHGKEAVRLRATLTDWDLTRDGTPQFEGSEVGGRYSATSWLRIAPPEQVIEPGASATVRFSASGAGRGGTGRVSNRHPLRVRVGVGGARLAEA